MLRLDGQDGRAMHVRMARKWLVGYDGSLLYRSGKAHSESSILTWEAISRNVYSSPPENQATQMLPTWGPSRCLDRGSQR